MRRERLWLRRRGAQQHRAFVYHVRGRTGCMLDTCMASSFSSPTYLPGLRATTAIELLLTLIVSSCVFRNSLLANFLDDSK